MLSTLFLLVLSGLFLQSIISISSNYIIQLNQLSSAYQAETALNMSEKILRDYLSTNDEQPEQVRLSSSAGEINISRKSASEYEAIITQENGMSFHQKIDIPIRKIEENETEDSKIKEPVESSELATDEIADEINF